MIGVLCQYCHKNIANVHFTQVIDNNRIEMYICESCAREKGQFNFGGAFNINYLLQGLMGMSPGVHHGNTVQVHPVCDKCGMSYEDFQKTGKIGCANCYEAYGDRLDSLLKRLHGSVEHSGKYPEKVSGISRVSREIEKLKELLNKAIQDEEYEKAAVIRDKIKSLEG